MSEFSRDIAVIIGINEYDNGIPKLSTARFDAKKLKEILQKKHGYEVKSFLDKQATSKNIWHYLKQELPEKIKQPEKVRLLFYFAGHGSPPEGEAGEAGYLLPQEAKIGQQDQWLSMKAIHDALIALECHHLLIILDCCYAGAFRFGTRDIGVMPEDISKERYQRYIHYKAGQVIVSTAHNKEAIDIIRDNRGMSENSVHSPFAELLFKALEYGDADYTNDGITTVTELNLYLYEKLLERTKDQKHPQVSRTWFLPFLDQGEFFFQTGDFDPDQLPDAITLNKNNNPYRGLKPFEEAHSNFFFGRTDKIQQLEKRLNNDESFTVILGISGSGKSSLVKAGLIPKLRQNNKKWRILEPIAPESTVFKDLAKAVLPLILESSDPDLYFLQNLGDILKQARKRDKYNEQIKELFAQWRITSPEDKLVLIIKHFHILEKLCESQDQKQSLATLRTIGLNHSRLVLDHFDEIKEYCNNLEQEKLEQFNKKCNQYIKNLSEQWQQNGQQFGKFLLEHCPEDKQVKILLVIDQFEHCINQCTNEQRKQFLNALQAALDNCSQQIRLVLTLRSDFQHYFENSEHLKDYWQNASFPLKQMERDQLRETIEKPALAQVLYFETNDNGKSLVDELLDDIGETPGALPLLSFTLSELYFKYVQKQRGDRTLTWEDYHELGGVTQSLTRRATEEYNNLAKDYDKVDGHVIKVDPLKTQVRQTVLRWVMLRMVNLDGGEKAKRRVLDDELEYGDEKTNQNRELVINRFVDARLLVTGTNLEGNSYVEPIHDVLIREWDKITTWLSTTKKDVTEAQQQSKAQTQKKQRFRFNLPFIGRNKKSGTEQERFNLNLQRDLTDAAFKYEEASEKQSPKVFGLLWDDAPRLPGAEQVLKSDDNWLNKVETEFVKRQIRKANLNRGIVIAVISGLSALTIIAVFFSLVAENRRMNADIIASSLSAKNLPDSEQQLESITSAIRVGKLVKDNNKNIDPDARIQAITALQKVVYNNTSVNSNFRQRNRLEFPVGQTTSIINSVTFSKDGLIGTTYTDGTIALWKADGANLKTFKAHEDTDKGARSISFSPDGETFVSSGDRSVQLWNINGTLIRVLGKHNGSVPSVSFSPNGKIIASASGDGTIKLWNPNGNLLKTIKQAHSPYVHSVEFSPDGTVLASSGSDGMVKFWTADGNFIKEINHGSHVYDVSFSRDGQMIASAGEDRNVKIWKRDGTPIMTFQAAQNLTSHGNAVYEVSFSPDRKIASASQDHTVRIWTLDGILLQTLKADSFYVESVTFSKDGEYLASGGRDGTVKLWSDNQQVQPRLMNSDKKTLSFSQDSQLIAYGTIDNTVEILKTKDLKPFKTIDNYDESIEEVVFSPNSKIIGIANQIDGIVQLGNLDDTPPVFLPTDSTFLNSINFDPKSQVVATGRTLDGKVELWSVDGNFIQSFNTESPAVSDLQFSPDSRLIAIGTWAPFLNAHGTVILGKFNGEKIEHYKTLKGHRNWVTEVSFSSDGEIIASASQDSTIMLWSKNGVSLRL
ncbi:nSTAND1 domain-containing NTPase [Crocosphaera chwakensis]|uniref:Peptidase C14, caspase catalytic subunit p20 n=1 Tax=Crocosphaera chwakensis CCY0110 TaxID=391612 RepID=A3IUU0_9CHRO|nr:caspase family protein [Crocosphaera chwakensis]EAZ89783.1 Peptidase C14, caspase catalytic subunit p20 [Crocosphaera chwakensis CCY0110]